MTPGAGWAAGFRQNFAAAELGKQYSSVFVNPRPEWAVDNVKDFFNITEDLALLDIEFTEEDVVRAQFSGTSSY